MTIPMENECAVSLAETLTDVRDRCLAVAPTGVRKDLAHVRGLLDAARDECGSEIACPLEAALGRLGMTVEVWECLASEGSASADEIAAFVAEACDRLAGELHEGVAGDAAVWILQESARRWGEYLALFDPSWSFSAPEDQIPDDMDSPAEADSEPAFDASELLRRLTGAAPTPSAVESAVPSDPAVEIEASNGDGQTIDDTPVQVSMPRASRDQESLSVIQARDLDMDAELRAVFLADAADLFARIQDLVLGLGQDTGRDTESLHELGRCFHTLKGASGSVGLTAMASEIHQLEDRLEGAGGVASEELAGCLEAALVTIERVLETLDGPRATGLTPTTTDQPLDLTARPEDEGATEFSPFPEPNPVTPRALQPTVEPDGLIRVSAERFEDLLELASDMIGRRRFWSEQAGKIKQFADTARSCHQRMRSGIERLETTVRDAVASQGTETLATAFNAAEDFPAMIRRLTEQADDLAALASSAGDMSIPMVDESETLSRLSRQLWDTLQDIRIVPIRSLFQRLVRVAREAGRVEGRTIELRLVGEDTGADRPLLDRLYEPLLHVVRNAVGHGIEPPEERVRAGKSAAGHITLEARREGNTLVLVVQDDGRGLDNQAIESKARRLGLLGPDEPVSPECIQALIFHPGFSTRSEANAISGRGVGMDVVAREVAQLRGRIDLTSKDGQGTRLTLRLPSRLSLEQVMIVRVAGQSLAVPIALVDSIHRVDETTIDLACEPGRVNVAGQERKLVDLRSILGYSCATRCPCPTLLIARHDGRPVAVLVDGIDGSYELVIKPLGPLLAGHPAISGTSLTMSGEVVLALDLAGVIRLAHGGGLKTLPEMETVAPGIPVLVVDDSLSVRRVATRHLRMLGFEVDEAIDGEQALGRLRDRSYRLILTDLEMPRMDGFALLAELSRTGVLNSTPVVVTSTRIDGETRRKAHDLGAAAFVAKPVSSEDLARVVLPLMAAHHEAIPHHADLGAVCC